MCTCKTEMSCNKSEWKSSLTEAGAIVWPMSATFAQLVHPFAACVRYLSSFQGRMIIRGWPAKLHGYPRWEEGGNKAVNRAKGEGEKQYGQNRGSAQQHVITAEEQQSVADVNTSAQFFTYPAARSRHSLP
jgi:hypothetical protein